MRALLSSLAVGLSTPNSPSLSVGSEFELHECDRPPDATLVITSANEQSASPRYCATVSIHLSRSSGDEKDVPIYWCDERQLFYFSIQWGAHTPYEYCFTAPNTRINFFWA